MSRLIRRKKEEKDVQYEELKRGEAFRIKIGPAKADIVAWRLPQYEDVQAKGEASALPGKVAGEYKHREYGKWETVIKTEDLPLMPLDAWKKKVAETLSVVSGSYVSPETVKVSVASNLEGATPICPNCKKPLFIVGLEYCPNCGSKLQDV